MIAILFNAGNPTVLSSNPEVRLLLGPQEQLGQRPSLTAFISGTPQPTNSNITWYFNNQQQLPDGTLIDGNQLLLPKNIQFEVNGIFRCQVNTSAGIDYDNFKVTVIGEIIYRI